MRERQVTKTSSPPPLCQLSVRPVKTIGRRPVGRIQFDCTRKITNREFDLCARA
jgi:hypothetical protein